MDQNENIVPDRVVIGGVGISAINLDDAVNTVQHWIENGTQTYVCVTGAHGVMECQRDERLRQIHNDAGLVTPDGMPVVWVARLLGRKRTRRAYGPDLMRKMTALSAERGYRQFYYGGAPGVAEKLRGVLGSRYPSLQIAGTLCPPFRKLTPEEDEEVVATINAARPDIVWVALSTPKQEFWMADHLGRINAPVMIGVGAAFDFLAGTKRQAPLWVQRGGLEWMFRLCSEPRRLWRRYAYIVPGFLLLAARSLIRQAILPPRPALTGLSPECEADTVDRLRPALSSRRMQDRVAWMRSRHAAPGTAVAEVLQRLKGPESTAQWSVTALGEGAQAWVFAARPAGCASTHDASAVVVKLYKRVVTREQAEEQVRALQDMHRTLNGRSVAGWNIAVPTPLCLSRNPLALVMTKTPGQSLLRHLEHGRSEPMKYTESLARAVVSGISMWWQLRRVHGDLNFDNILCDLESRTLSFLDAGPLMPCAVEVHDQSLLLSHDLGYLLYEALITIRRSIWWIGAETRKQTFAKEILRAALRTLPSVSDRRRFLNEVQSCAQSHLMGLDLSVTPRGLWCGILRVVGRYRILSLLGALRTEFGDTQMLDRT